MSISIVKIRVVTTHGDGYIEEQIRYRLKDGDMAEGGHDKLKDEGSFYTYEEAMDHRMNLVVSVTETEVEM